jgi:hypothetical protein
MQRTATAYVLFFVFALDLLKQCQDDEQQIGDKSSFTLRKSGTKNLHTTSEQRRDSAGVMSLKHI